MRAFARIQMGLKPEKSDKPEPRPDWGLNRDFDSYLSFRFQVWVRSGFTVWPKTGGMDDQEADLVDDFMTLLSAMDYEQFHLKDDKG